MQGTRKAHGTLALGALVVVVVALAGCAAGDPRFTVDTPAGFWGGLWHGMISCITLVIGIFSDNVRVYEPHNTGGWYDFGFVLGVASVWGAGHRAGTTNRKPRDAEWEEIGRKVEIKLARMIRAWAEAEPDEDWHVVGEKAERKLKQRLRQWADEPTDAELVPPTAGGPSAAA